jgi:transcriptional regulator with XRE-family HTH domain
MPTASRNQTAPLHGHALRNANLRQRSLARSQDAPELARSIVRLRADTLGMTRLEFSRRSGISRGTLRDLELGVHTPTRQTLQRFVSFCQKQGAAAEQVEEIRRLYAGNADDLFHFIARLELQAGSPRELACRVGISPATLWEYRRGHFPLPFSLLCKLCEAVGQDPELGRSHWEDTERKRLQTRGYPTALVEFWLRCEIKGLGEKQLLALGLRTAAARRLRYLELPPWAAVAKVARQVCRDDEDVGILERAWSEGERHQKDAAQRGFGTRLQELRKERRISRRELADLFGIRGKKPARIIKNIEEDGFYSMQAYPAGMVALLTDGEEERRQHLETWRQRRRQFHMRHRPETRTDLRLVREQYGLGLADMRSILGYSSLEYQRIERGILPLLESAYHRILDALERAGRERVEGLLRLRTERETRREAWQWPGTVAEMIGLLARREGGMIPLARCLKRLEVHGFWAGRLRALASGRDLPPWRVLERVGQVCGVADLSQVHLDWADGYRAQLRRAGRSPLGVELRLMISELAPTLREFCRRLGFNDSVLVRDLQRLDRDEPMRWFHVERILHAAGIPADDPRRLEIRCLWATAGERRRSPAAHKRRAAIG